MKLLPKVLDKGPAHIDADLDAQIDRIYFRASQKKAQIKQRPYKSPRAHQRAADLEHLMNRLVAISGGRGYDWREPDSKLRFGSVLYRV